jgi:4-hydroxybenzoate polyprenyltransferase
LSWRCNWTLHARARLYRRGAHDFVSVPQAFFPLPQFYLGLAFGWAVPMAYAAQSGHRLPRVAWVLFMTAVLWACIYDTIYAMVDRDDDVKIGVRRAPSCSPTWTAHRRDHAGDDAVRAHLVGRAMKFGDWYLAGVGAARCSFCTSSG